eukprot:gene25290-biopygen2985
MAELCRACARAPPRRYRRLIRCYPRGGRDARAPRDAGTGGSFDPQKRSRSGPMCWCACHHLARGSALR